MMASSFPPFNKHIFINGGPPSETTGSEISSVESDWGDLRLIAAQLGVANPDDLHVERFKVDRQKLEDMIKGVILYWTTMGDAPSRRERRGGGHKPPSANSAGDSGNAVPAGVSPPAPPTGNPALSSPVTNRGCEIEPDKARKSGTQPGPVAAAAVKAAACRQAVDLALAVVGEPRSAAGVCLVFDKGCQLALSALGMEPSSSGTAGKTAVPARAEAPVSTARAPVRRSTGGGGGCALGDSPLAQLAVGVGEMDRRRTPAGNYRRRKSISSFPQRTEQNAAPNTQGSECSPKLGPGTAAVRPPGRGQGAAGRGGTVGANPVLPIKRETFVPIPSGQTKQEPKVPPST